MRKLIFAKAKTKMQISFAVTAKLISTFVLAKKLVQFLFYLNSKFQASSLLLLMCSSVCVRPVQKPGRPISETLAHIARLMTHVFLQLTRTDSPIKPIISLDLGYLYFFSAMFAWTWGTFIFFQQCSF